jgi:hypothetical protein
VRNRIDTADVVGDKKKRESQATVLINLASECGCEFFHDGQECYATIPINDHRETWSLGSRGFKRWLARLYFGVTGAAANADTINTAVTTLRLATLMDDFATTTKQRPYRNTHCARGGSRARC